MLLPAGPNFLNPCHLHLCIHLLEGAHHPYTAVIYHGGETSTMLDTIQNIDMIQIIQLAYLRNSQCTESGVWSAGHPRGLVPTNPPTAEDSNQRRCLSMYGESWWHRNLRYTQKTWDMQVMRDTVVQRSYRIRSSLLCFWPPGNLHCLVYKSH